MPHALVLDDDLNFQSALAELVEREGFSTSVAGTLEEAGLSLPTTCTLTSCVICVPLGFASTATSRERA